MMGKLTNIHGVSRYEDLTTELMMDSLKEGIDDFEFYFDDTAESKKYIADNISLTKEYIERIEVSKPGVGGIRLASRGLEALMWYRDEIAIKKLSELWDENNYSEKSLKEKLHEDSMYSAANEFYDNVRELVRKSNYEQLWIWTSLSAKKSLLDKWGYTLFTDSEDIHDENSAFPFHSKRELRIFEEIMGREFEEFDSLLR